MYLLTTADRRQTCAHRRFGPLDEPRARAAERNALEPKSAVHASGGASIPPACLLLWHRSARSLYRTRSNFLLTKETRGFPLLCASADVPQRAQVQTRLPLFRTTASMSIISARKKDPLTERAHVSHASSVGGRDCLARDLKDCASNRGASRAQSPTP